MMMTMRRMLQSREGRCEGEKARRTVRIMGMMQRP